jgi:hypothetical protein
MDENRWEICLAGLNPSPISDHDAPLNLTGDSNRVSISSWDPAKPSIDPVSHPQAPVTTLKFLCDKRRACVEQ